MNEDNMSDYDTFWYYQVKSILLAVLTLVALISFAILADNFNERAKISEALSEGVPPIAAKCALGVYGSTNWAVICGGIE